MDTDEDKEVEDMEVDTDEQTGTVAAGSAETPKKTGKEKKAKAGSAEKSKAAAKPVKKEAEGKTKREGAGRPSPWQGSSTLSPLSRKGFQMMFQDR